MRIFDPMPGQRGATIELHRWELEKLISYIDSLGRDQPTRPLAQLRDALIVADVVHLPEEVVYTNLNYLELTQLANIMMHLVNGEILIRSPANWRAMLDHVRHKVYAQTDQNGEKQIISLTSPVPQGEEDAM